MAVVALVAAGIGGCDSGPRGPGTLDGTVVGSEGLGAATLEVTGRGVVGFEGAGDTEAYGTIVSGQQQRHRVVLVNPTGEGLDFRILVEDVGADPPSVTVVAAVGPDNEDRATDGVEALIGP